jgi:hypothetical protein
MLHRHLDPLRIDRFPRDGTCRRAIQDCLALLDELNQIDAQLAALAARRHQVVGRLHERRNYVTPRLSNHHGRKPKVDGTIALPPIATHAVSLWGTRLRDMCISVLRRCGTLTLVEIHAMLHHLGFRIDSGYPPKTLSDALSYETEHGRARRVGRGLYAPIGPARPDAPRPTHRPCLPLDHLPETISPQAA